MGECQHRRRRARAFGILDHLSSIAFHHSALRRRSACELSMSFATPDTGHPFCRCVPSLAEGMQTPLRVGSAAQTSHDGRQFSKPLASSKNPKKTGAYALVGAASHPNGARSARSYSSRSKIWNERSQCLVCGFFRSGSRILKARARAKLSPPAMVETRASVSSL
jgi:hypothetical protein